MIMEKYKCDENVYGRQCDDSFRSESQLKKHINMNHKKYVVDKKPEPKTEPIFNIWSGKMVDWNISEVKHRKVKPSDMCHYGCGKRAYIMQTPEVPVCYGTWSTWGCFYTKEMIDYDRKWFKIPIRNRNTYDARPFTKKERKKIIKQVTSLEYEVWSPVSYTPVKELEYWHDDKLRREVRSLEYVKANPV